MTEPLPPDDPERKPSDRPELPETWKHPSEPRRESGTGGAIFKGLGIVFGVVVVGVLLLFGVCSL